MMSDDDYRSAAQAMGVACRTLATLLQRTDWPVPSGPGAALLRARLGEMLTDIITARYRFAALDEAGRCLADGQDITGRDDLQSALMDTMPDTLTETEHADQIRQAGAWLERLQRDARAPGGHHEG